ncbi:MAG: prepilin-type N-terminal cleavage/methylation domain-containing protein [Candidatus Moranbacteria bacterium]|nr:prepilin-type N-terminal cleavage/methylation domain-containing protein [Candidatus Moranbacteria bacterium]
MNTKIKNKKGFSLVEVLISLLILSVGVAAVSVLMTNNIKNSITAKNQVIAAQLAQEGVELVKNLKDNQLATVFTTNADITANHTDYRIDLNSDFATFSGSSGATNKQLYLNTGIFSHTINVASKPTKFFRQIAVVITIVDAKRVATVTSYVTWNGTGVPLPLSSCNVATKCVSIVAVLPDLE